MVAQKPRRRHYSTGDEALDGRIVELVAVAGPSHDSDLLEEMIKTCFRLDRDRSDRGEMKLVNAALKEFAYAFKVFKGYKSYRKVGIFGSARSVQQDPAYEVTRNFAAAILQTDGSRRLRCIGYRQSMRSTAKCGYTTASFAARIRKRAETFSLTSIPIR